jgi:hypothetical protein
MWSSIPPDSRERLESTDSTGSRYKISGQTFQQLYQLLNRRGIYWRDWLVQECILLDFGALAFRFTFPSLYARNSFDRGK